MEMQEPADLDCYRVLRVRQEAIVNDIKKAFRKLALVYHPDRVYGRTDAGLHLRRIRDAHDTLIRTEWDKYEAAQRDQQKAQGEGDITRKDAREEEAQERAARESAERKMAEERANREKEARRKAARERKELAERRSQQAAKRAREAQEQAARERLAQQLRAEQAAQKAKEAEEAYQMEEAIRQALADMEERLSKLYLA
ncbi:MAG: hypothetical protein M1830_000829 [Pleopsidium flavum]|nr:MAG: hypothetical protein M1830_000829 [Pleopsidium flavum]